MLHIDYGKKFSKVQSSKFCMGKFLKIRNKAFDLLAKLGIEHPCNELQSIQDFVSEMEGDSSHYKYLNFEQSFNENNSKMLSEMNKELINIQKGDSLVLIGYSLLTQLNVGVLYILSHMFQSLGLILNEQLGCMIILKYNLRTESILECFKKVHAATIEAEAVGESVLSILPITKLCGEKNSLNLATGEVIIHHIL